MSGAQIVVLVVVGFILILLFAAIRIVNEWERGVVKRLGRVIGAKGPGLFLVIPFIDQVIKMNLQIVAMAVPPQDTVTRDNVTIRVDAVVFFQVFDPVRALVEVQNYVFATSQIAQTTLRSIVGAHELQEVLSERNRINEQLQVTIDELTEPWGVKVTATEIKDVDLPQGMQRAMARQAEAERERRAKIIAADGEFQASAKLREAAMVMQDTPIAYQLRLLQTMAEVATEKNSTLILPIPIELLRPYADAFRSNAQEAPPAPRVIPTGDPSSLEDIVFEDEDDIVPPPPPMPPRPAGT